MKYELMAILNPKFSEKELEKTLNEIKTSMKENDFTVKEEDIWGHRPLAYKIKGFDQGYYVVMTLEGESTGTMELKKDLRLQTGIIRHMLIKTPDDYVLTHFEKPMMAAGKSKKLNKHAEELSKKVRAKKSTSVEEKSAEEPKNDADLDEKLQAIVDDADIDL